MQVSEARAILQSVGVNPVMTMAGVFRYVLVSRESHIKLVPMWGDKFKWGVENHEHAAN